MLIFLLLCFHKYTRIQKENMETLSMLILSKLTKRNLRYVVKYSLLTFSRTTFKIKYVSNIGQTWPLCQCPDWTIGIGWFIEYHRPAIAN